MPNETGLDTWLSMSHALFFALIPQETKPAVLAARSQPEHAFLIHREVVRVDRALISMALSTGETECRAIVAALTNDTVIALACRWGSYTEKWQATAIAPEKYPWQPPNQRDLWRAVLLSMASDRAAQTTAAQQLWGAEWPGLRE